MTERKIIYWVMLFLVLSIGSGLMRIYISNIHPLIADTLGNTFPFKGSDEENEVEGSKPE